MFAVISLRSVLLRQFSKLEFKAWTSEAFKKFSFRVLYKSSPRHYTTKVITGSIAPNQGVGVTSISMNSKVHFCLIWNPESQLLCHLAKRRNLIRTSQKQNDHFFHTGSLQKKWAIEGMLFGLLWGLFCGFVWLVFFKRRKCLWESDFHYKMDVNTMFFLQTYLNWDNK